ncbi:MAG: AsmA family protein [Reyranellaceae bacterium]
MSSSARKLLLGTGAVVGAIVVVLLALPFLIDVDGYKPQIVQAVKRATGRELVLGGPIGLQILPLPVVTVHDVKLGNPPGAASPDMVRIQSVTVRPSLWALLRGELAPSEVVLVRPKIVLEVNAAGKPSWDLAPSPAEAKPASGTPSPPRPLSLGRLAIEDGTVTFSDSQAGLSLTAEKANFTASVGSIEGPVALSGEAILNGAPLRLALSVGDKAADGHAVGLRLEAGGGTLAVVGRVSELGPQARLTAKITAAADNLVAFATTLAGLAGQKAPAIPPLLGGRFAFEGTVEASQTGARSPDFKLVLGEDPGTGSFSVTLAPSLVVEASYAAKRLDLDRWLAGLAVPTQVAAPVPTVSLDSPPAAAAAAPRSALAALDGTLRVQADEIVYNKQSVREAALELHTKDGIVAVPRLHVRLPGDLVIEARSTLSSGGDKPSAAGEFSLKGPRLRDTMDWAGVDVSGVPAQRLGAVAMTGHLTSREGSAVVTDAAFQLDDLKGTGGIVVSFTVPLSVVTHLEFETVDIDSYLPKDIKPSASQQGSSLPILALLGPAVGFKVSIAKLIYRGETIARVLVDVARDRGTLRLNDLDVASLAGARLKVRGAVAGYWEDNPSADVAFSFDTPDLSRVLHLAGMAHAGLGAASASGSIAGTLERLDLREVTVSALGWSGKASGTLAMPGLARGTPSDASYKGNLTLNGDGIEVSVEATRLADRPQIVADLKASVLDLDRLRGTSPSRPPAGSPPQPIDTGPLRSFDGRFHLAAVTLAAGPVRLSNADIAASLKDGVLTISQIKGGLYGGGLTLAGKVDGSGPALAVDLHGNANGLPIGGLLRSTAGSNTFGSVVNVSIDGVLNADDLRVQGRGATTAELVGSMSGGARLGGSVRVSADRFMQILGGAATGVVGGAIDSTVGNLMSLTGERGGVGLANLLNAISLVLNRFVNNDDGIGGQVDIAGGVLTARGLAVQGRGATANIATRTNLAAATTSTTISFVIAEDPSGPYLITTANGPLSSLSFTAVRGTAKDPPGIESMVPNISRLIPGTPSSLVPHIPVPPISVPRIPLPSLPNPFGR